MLLYLLPALATGLLLYFLFRWLVEAEPKQVKRLLMVLGAVALIALVAVFSKYGAAIAAAVLTLTVVVRRVMALVSAYHFFKKINPHAPKPPRETPMDVKEACDILGVSTAATEEEIKAAYHRLMQRNHPDQGGSDYFAKKLNQARDVLLKKRR